MFRPAESGSSTAWRAVEVRPMVGFVLFSSTASRLPVTVSASPMRPTGSSTLSVTSVAVLTRRSRFSTVENPDSSARTE